MFAMFRRAWAALMSHLIMEDQWGEVSRLDRMDGLTDSTDRVLDGESNE